MGRRGEMEMMKMGGMPDRSMRACSVGMGNANSVGGVGPSDGLLVGDRRSEGRRNRNESRALKTRCTGYGIGRLCDVERRDDGTSCAR